MAICVLVALVFSKFFYMSSLGNYLTFYLIETFGVSVQSAQLYLFVFLAAVAAGTFLGGPIGDRFGRKYVIWFSILGVLPFTLMLPHANLFWTLGAGDDHRAHHVIGLFGNSRLRSRACAGTCRPDRRTLLRSRLRHGRPRRGPSRRACRPSQVSDLSTRFALSCRRSGSSPGSCPISNARRHAQGLSKLVRDGGAALSRPRSAGLAQLVEHLICNQGVTGLESCSRHQ